MGNRRLSTRRRKRRVKEYEPFLTLSDSALLGLGYGLALPSVQAQAVNVSEEQVRPRVLPMAGMLFEGAILGFPLVAGWIITGFGYRALFALLLAFVLVQVIIAWWRFLVAGRFEGTQEV